MSWARTSNNRHCGVAISAPKVGTQHGGSSGRTLGFDRGLGSRSTPLSMDRSQFFILREEDPGPSCRPLPRDEGGSLSAGQSRPRCHRPRIGSALLGFRRLFRRSLLDTGRAVRLAQRGGALWDNPTVHTAPETRRHLNGPQFNGEDRATMQTLAAHAGLPPSAESVARSGVSFALGLDGSASQRRSPAFAPPR